MRGSGPGALRPGVAVMETIISSARHRALQLRTARKGGFTAAARRTFLDALAATCHVTLAARAAGLPARTCYRWRPQHSPFADAWQEALELGSASCRGHGCM